MSQAVLEADLLRCPVQVSSNTETTAFHGNAHRKLPKVVVADLADLPTSDQAARTPYIEFLVEGHKSSSGIERGILDRDSGQIYLTAHYDQGSFVWLSGAPGTLVADWHAKAQKYAALYQG